MRSALPRILMIAAAALVAAVFFFPLWTFAFDVPQYPEGLGMQIWVNKLTGELLQINALNHYVGMRPITADSFPELTYFPWLLVALAVSAVVCAIVLRRWLLIVWSGAFLGFGAFGVADFVRWTYEYGHNLNARAPIKIDPFTPPILGRNTILNFTIIAGPGVGGYLLLASFVAGLLAMIVYWRRTLEPHA